MHNYIDTKIVYKYIYKYTCTQVYWQINLWKYIYFATPIKFCVLQNFDAKKLDWLVGKIKIENYCQTDLELHMLSFVQICCFTHDKPTNTIPIFWTFNFTSWLPIANNDNFITRILSLSPLFMCPNFFFLIGIHSMQGWTATTRHGITRKRSTQRSKHTGNIFRKNLQLIGVC